MKKTSRAPPAGPVREIIINNWRPAPGRAKIVLQKVSVRNPNATVLIIFFFFRSCGRVDAQENTTGRVKTRQNLPLDAIYSNGGGGGGRVVRMESGVGRSRENYRRIPPASPRRRPTTDDERFFYWGDRTQVSSHTGHGRWKSPAGGRLRVRSREKAREIKKNIYIYFQYCKWCFST